jgi:hypothetical protein
MACSSVVTRVNQALKNLSRSWQEWKYAFVGTVVRYNFLQTAPQLRECYVNLSNLLVCQHHFQKLHNSIRLRTFDSTFEPLLKFKRILCWYFHSKRLLLSNTINITIYRIT